MVSQEEENYYKYILEHTENVLRAYTDYGDQILKIMGNESLKEDLFNTVNAHDKSKFSGEEFDGYRKFFYPIKNENKDLAKDAMNVAWLHHMNTNKHHPEYWVLRDKDGNHSIPMERLYIAEMILDWIAMGYKFKSNALKWFNKNEQYYKTIMTVSTFYTVKKVLTTLFEEDN
jgi:hypothetical protein